MRENIVKMFGVEPKIEYFDSPSSSITSPEK